MEDREVVKAESIGSDMSGVNANTEVPGTPGQGQQGITRGAMTDSYTGVSTGSVGTGSIGLPSNVSGLPTNEGTIDESSSLGLLGHDIPGRMTDVPSVPGTSPTPGAPSADASSVGSVSVDQVPQTTFSTPGATDPVATTSGTMGTMGVSESPASESSTKFGVDNTSGLPESNSNDYLDDFRGEFDRNFSQLGMTYDQALPAYEYGREMAASSQDDWAVAEQRLRQDWEVRQPGTWIMYRNIARAGWERAAASRSNGRAQML
jgi:hypothetical protein